MKKIRLSFFAIILAFVFLIPINSLASNSADYGVKVRYPENQLKETGESGYFDLLVEPGKNYVLTVEVYNYTDKKIVVYGDASRVATTGTGVLNYNVSEKESKEIAKKLNLDEQLNFENMIDIHEKKLEIDPKGTKNFDIDLKVPNKSFDGEILGGLHFRQEKELSEEEQKNMIVNSFTYSVPIILQTNKNRVENELSLGEVGPELRDDHPFISAEIMNHQLSIVRQLKVDGKINDKKSGQTVYVRKEDSYQMAPYSILKYGFDLQDTPIKPGSYEVILKIEADGKNYKFKKDFEIEKKESEKFNESSVFLIEENNTYLYIVIAIVVLLTVVFVILKINKSKRGK